MERVEQVKYRGGIIIMDTDSGGGITVHEARSLLTAAAYPIWH